MIKIRVLGRDGQDKLILINQSNIVTVEEVSEDRYDVFLSDGRILQMNKEMYEDHFVNDEDDEDESVIISYGEQA
jgi:hypothetical protein